DPNRLDEAPPAAEGLVHRGGLEPAVHHAVPALGVAALPAVALPARGLHEILEALGVPLLEEVAGALPPEQVEGRVAPGRALRSDPNRLDEAPPAAEGLVHRGGLEPAVHHAVPALGVAALPAVALPARGLHEILEALGVPLLEEVAGALPPEQVEGRVAPGRAL